VGQKVDLEFDLESLRIRDLGEDQQSSTGFVKPTNILDSIKTSSRMTTGSAESTETEKITADVQSTKLKQLLGTIKAS
jgi:hypothetical protein